MKKIKIFELFAGIGSVRSAFERLGIEYESLGYSEIDKFAIASYCTLYNDKEENNFGDITQIKALPQGLDLLYHGSPCQDFSFAGLGKGGDIGTETRSSLMWETCRLVQQSLPRVVIWENVKGVLQAKHRHNFDKYLDFMQSLGYLNNYEILQGTDFNVPQTRPRVFVVSTLSEKSFNFPAPIEQTLLLADLLERNAEPESYLSAKKVMSINFNDKMLKTIGHKDSQVVERVADLNFIKFNSRKGVYSPKGMAPTLMCCSGENAVKIVTPTPETNINFLDFYGKTEQEYHVYQINDSGVGAVRVGDVLYSVRKLTPKEYWRLMGFSDSQFKDVAEHTSNSQLYKQAGNSIVVDINKYVIKELVNQGFLQTQETPPQLQVEKVMRDYDAVYSIVDLICKEVESDKEILTINREQVVAKCCGRLLEKIKEIKI